MVSMCLTLDSSTTLGLRLTPEDGAEGAITYSVDGGEAAYAEALSDGRFGIALSDISARYLGRPYTILIQASGEAAIEVSALSYVDLVLQSEVYKNDSDMRNAMVALYNYYSAAQAF